jgi:preprotein translocase subunit YajC
MIDVFGLPVVVAQGAPVTPPSLVGELWPFAVMLLIFYFIVLMPMRSDRRRSGIPGRKTKAGDRVITTGGIHGQVTKSRRHRQDQRSPIGPSTLRGPR